MITAGYTYQFVSFTQSMSNITPAYSGLGHMQCALQISISLEVHKAKNVSIFLHDRMDSLLT